MENCLSMCYMEKLLSIPHFEDHSVSTKSTFAPAIFHTMLLPTGNQLSFSNTDPETCSTFALDAFANKVHILFYFSCIKEYIDSGNCYNCKRGVKREITTTIVRQ